MRGWLQLPVEIRQQYLLLNKPQYHLCQMFVFLNMYPINQPEVMIGNAAERFDAKGNLTDESTKDFIRQLLQNLVDWTRRIGQSQ